jgi:hypothetical protein
MCGIESGPEAVVKRSANILPGIEHQFSGRPTQYSGYYTKLQQHHDIITLFVKYIYIYIFFFRNSSRYKYLHFFKNKPTQETSCFVDLITVTKEELFQETRNLNEYLISNFYILYSSLRPLESQNLTSDAAASGEESLEAYTKLRLISEVLSSLSRSCHTYTALNCRLTDES